MEAADVPQFTKLDAEFHCSVFRSIDLQPFIISSHRNRTKTVSWILLLCGL